MIDIMTDIDSMILQRVDEIEVDCANTEFYKNREILLKEATQILDSIGNSELSLQLYRTLKDYDFWMYKRIYMQALKDAASIQKNLLEKR